MNVTTRSYSFLLLVWVCRQGCWAFSVHPHAAARTTNYHYHYPRTFPTSPTFTFSRRVDTVAHTPATHTTTTQLYLLLDVPDGFFTVTFAGLGLLLSISKTFVRARMEEAAWEQRLREGRRERLAKDPSLTELDLRRQEAAMEWSAYGEPRRREEQQLQQRQPSRRKRTTTTMTMERPTYTNVNDNDNDNDDGDRRTNTLSREEIEELEAEFGIDYDPYYDDPYTEEELPEGKFKVDRRYGDRIYDNGEIFYKEKETGVYYRQGAKPRNLSFF